MIGLWPAGNWYRKASFRKRDLSGLTIRQGLDLNFPEGLLRFRAPRNYNYGHLGR
jgi:hypothetical protein